MSASQLNTERLLEDLRRVVRDSEDLLQATAGVAGEKASEVRERLSGALEAARQNCLRLEQRAQEKVLEGARAADRAVREHPYPSMGIAFGVGLLVGVLVTRK